MDLDRGYYTFRLRNGQSGCDGAESGTEAALLLTAEWFDDRITGEVGRIMNTVRPLRPVCNAKEETFMDNNAKETNRPLDQEELTQDQEEKVVGGVQVNIANLNTANINNGTTTFRIFFIYYTLNSKL